MTTSIEDVSILHRSKPETARLAPTPFQLWIRFLPIGVGLRRSNKWGLMKRPITILAASLLILIACSAPAKNAEKAEPSTTSQGAPVAVSVSCKTLIGSDGGLVSRAAAFLRDIKDLTPETRREAKEISEKLGEVARTATTELKEPLAGMQKPLDGIAQSSDGFTLEPASFKAAGNSVISICSGESATPTPTPTPTPARVSTGLTYKLSCSIKTTGQTTFSDYRAAWSQPFDLCYALSASGTPSPAEKAAADGYSKDADGAKHLYGLCATTAGHYVEETVSSSQAKEITKALTLCPDHPKRAQLEVNAAAGLAAEADSANGKLVGSGKYLVGKTAQPGTWQSQGEKVEDCYWEISDAQGNIIENNFISVAPQFTIYIPPTASGFTVRGCSFRWISN